ncbi:hypothetical protein ACN2XU_15675 [Primorskyibacter sp. 2E107]|uniref:hypothetical protein n=1 Tax=Primorskyibacter sp. 2E107 TaxID=3403458 RepID=UPI003AF6F28A
MIRALASFAFLCAAAPVAAQDAASDLGERLRALAARHAAQVTLADPYADEKSVDLERITAESETLFTAQGTTLGPPQGDILIALFVSENCADCVEARRALAALTAQIAVRATVHDISAHPDAGAVMDRLGLDVTPSYVMRDRMIRGLMPALVLERYLSTE